MTGGMQVLMVASSGGHLSGQAGSVVNISASTGLRSGTFALVNDGTFTNTGNPAGNWWLPTTAAEGTLWWAKVTIVSQTNTTFSGSTGTWIQLTSGASWGMQNSLSSNEGTGSFTVAFSPDGGTTTAGTMNVNWDVGFAP